MASRMTGTKLRIGIVGCGRVVQTAHLAALAGLPDIEVTAICDPDAGVADRVGTRLGVAPRFTACADLVKHPDVEAVLVATRDHVEPALTAIEAGKHVLVEKPLCFDVGSAAAIDSAARDSGVVAMIGYMKRYDWCFERLCAMVADLPAIRFSSVHDFACRFDKSNYLFDVAQPALADDSGPPGLTQWLLMFASHDFAVVRGAVGEPEEVVFAESAGPRTLLIGLRCRGGRFCAMELSLDTRYDWFDETLTIYSDDQIIGIRFADPFVPFAQSQLRVSAAAGPAVAQQVITGPFEDAFRREWRHFAECVATGAAPRTPVREGVADAALAVEIASRCSRAAPS